MDGILYRRWQENIFGGSGASVDWYAKNAPFLDDARSKAEKVFDKKPGILTQGFVTQALRGPMPASPEEMDALPDTDKLGMIVYSLQHPGPVSRAINPLLGVHESNFILSSSPAFKDVKTFIENRKNLRPVGVIRDLQIAPEITGQGLRRDLIKHAAEHVSQSGAFAMIAFAGKNNDSLHKLFKDLGGRTTGKTLQNLAAGQGNVYKWDRIGLEEITNG